MVEALKMEVVCCPKRWCLPADSRGVTAQNTRVHHRLVGTSSIYNISLREMAFFFAFIVRLIDLG